MTTMRRLRASLTTASRRPPQAPAGSTPTEAEARASIYFYPQILADARSAYLVDWEHGGDCDVFFKWITKALTDYARLSPKTRADRAAAFDKPKENGAMRSYPVTEEAKEAVANAQREDKTVGLYLSASAWHRDAVIYAIEAARKRNGGNLPEVIGRLPKRLTRD